jgi:hypothetical protein
MELHVQKLLRSGWTLEKLKSELEIISRVNDRLGVVCLNYNQIASPMGNPAVQECRALVLEKDSWRVLSWPFPKFFNMGEGHIPKEFDWSNFKTYEKLDGSLIHFWHHDTEGWQCGTRSVPDAETGLDDTGLTFKQLVLKTIEEMGYDWNRWVGFFSPLHTYVYELCTPENMVVCDYGQERKLTLIGIRNLVTLQEYDIHQWAALHPVPGPLGPLVKQYPGFTLDAVKEEVSKRDPKRYEGYVLVDRKFNRVKIKSEAYVFMSGRKDSLQKSNRARIELILADAADDVLPNLPQFVQDKIKQLQVKLAIAIREIDALWEEVRHIEGDKDFALRVQHSGWSTPMFAIRKGKAADALGFFRKVTPKRVLEYINVLEEEDGEQTPNQS